MTCSFDARYRQLRADDAAGWAGDQHGRSLRKTGATLEHLARLGRLAPRGARVLEIGCGNGGSARIFKRLGLRYWGVDISPTAIKWARETNPGVPHARLRQGDVRHMPSVANMSMQMVYDSACLHCLIGQDRQKALSEIHRVLKPDGIFVMSSMCGLPRSMHDSLSFDRSRSLILRDGRPYRTLKSIESLRYELHRHGFRFICSGISVNAWWDHATVVFRRQ
jgi:ubiquinone/menaquinone biosynthesis C-methylase UbiE